MKKLLTLLCLALASCTTGGDPDAGADAGSIDDAGSDAFVPRDASVACEPGAHLGEACSGTVQCGDNCFCNGIELCVDGVCVEGDPPCADEVECTSDVCDEDEESCTFEADDAACADEDQCNGAERCVPFAGCRPGLRLACMDGDPCTVGRCDPTTGCAFETRDLDLDGFADHRCGGDDCFDDPADGATVFPGATEICDNERDDNCNGALDYRETSCSAVNDDCDTAEDLPGPGIYIRTTRGVDSDYVLGCRASGADAVFRFALDSAQDVEAQLSVDSGAGSVAIRRADACASGPDSHCGNTSVLARNLAAGEYVAIVKTATPTSFTLALSFLDATPILPVDVCNDDTFEITASGTFSGFYADVNDDYRPSCRSSTTTAYRDAAYRLVLTEDSDLVISARSMSSGTVSTYLSLTRDCTSAESTLSCRQATEPEIRRLSVPAGTYYIVLEPSTTSASTWALTVDIQPAMPRNEGDACGTSIDIGGATATIPLDTLVLDYGTSCGGSTASARDANFFFTLADTQDVILTTEAGGIHYVALHGACGDRVSETFCASGTPRVTRRFLRMAPGTYHVTVATTLASGDLTASAEILPPTFPPPNDTCAAPSELEHGVPQAGDLLAAGDDVMSCGPTAAADAVHGLTLLERQNVTAVARRTDGTSEPIFVGLRSPECEGTSSDLVCTSGAPALLNRTLDAGTHYFIVESAPSFVGPYSLTVYLADP
jgi:hypothetical protein